MSTIKGQLISSQRYLNMDIVNERGQRFKRFIVNVHPVVLRGVQYTILMDGHHNYAAAKLAGIEPDYRPAGKKVMKIINGMSPREQEALFINNVTDSNYYYVETGEVVKELLLPDTSCKFQAHAGNQWIFGGAA
ncbi:TPA: chromosome partitioning protein ParB [Raoultella ornithinolytica]|uniref:chromosome partitioning protein ParB n=1 Tax=Raoultella ornithinolytica TaxID=54291 RepID=UPI00277C5F82|nr:chromosome partitioning protein ParB [Raoultella ornithinolytica]